jgi:hypothetical protein
LSTFRTAMKSRVSLLFLCAAVPSHPVLDVVVDDEVQLLVREPAVRRQYPVDFIEDGLGQTWPKLLD